MNKDIFKKTVLKYSVLEPIAQRMTQTPASAQGSLVVIDPN